MLGKEPRKSKCSIKYCHTAWNGVKFSMEEQDAVMLTLNRVIPAWTEGLQLLGEGGKATLYVPSELGYGERGSNGIDPNTTLVFDIQLDSVKHFVEPVVEDKK